jgi:hypothetical protein
MSTTLDPRPGFGSHFSQPNDEGIIAARDILPRHRFDAILDAAHRYMDADRRTRYNITDISQTAGRLMDHVNHGGWQIVNNADTLARMAVKVGVAIEKRNAALTELFNSITLAMADGYNVTLQQFVIIRNGDGTTITYPRENGANA